MGGGRGIVRYGSGSWVYGMGFFIEMGKIGRGVRFLFVCLVVFFWGEEVMVDCRESRFLFWVC